jgi:hypothetical protein
MAKYGRVNLSVPGEMKQHARVKAILAGKDLSQVVRELLTLWLEGAIALPEGTTKDDPSG